jgi:hypothetical protein
MEKPKLIFVYNGNATVFELAAQALHRYQKNPSVSELESAHKILAAQLPYDIDFYHRSDFFLKFPETAGTKLPAVFLKHAHGLQRLMEAEELNHISTLEELKEKLLAHLATI